MREVQTPKRALSLPYHVLGVQYVKIGAAQASGSDTRTVVPLPGALVMSSRPP
jgi:hypothetical protein